jgi:hypothetical protein
MNVAARTLFQERSQPLVDPIQSLTNEWRSTRLAEFNSVFLRIALGGSFLSAVADHFGLWGAYGYPNAAWGSYPRFVAYTAKLLWLLPPATVPDRRPGGNAWWSSSPGSSAHVRWSRAIWAYRHSAAERVSAGQLLLRDRDSVHTEAASPCV